MFLKTVSPPILILRRQSGDMQQFSYSPCRYIMIICIQSFSFINGIMQVILQHFTIQFEHLIQSANFSVYLWLHNKSPRIKQLKVTIYYYLFQSVGQEFRQGIVEMASLCPIIYGTSAQTILWQVLEQMGTRQISLSLSPLPHLIAFTHLLHTASLGCLTA